MGSVTSSRVCVCVCVRACVYVMCVRVCDVCVCVMCACACVWCVRVRFISSISKAPSFQTLRLHKKKSQPLLFPPAPTCWGAPCSLIVWAPEKAVCSQPDSGHSSSLVLCKARVRSHSVSVTHLPDRFYCFLKLIGHENKVCSIGVNTGSGNSLKPAC